MRGLARLGGALVALAIVGLLGVIVASFVSQQHERIATTRDEQRGVAHMRPVAALLDGLVQAELLTARAGAGDERAAAAYPAVRRSLLDAFATIESAEQHHDHDWDIEKDVEALERALATLLPERIVGGRDALRAYGSLTDKTVALLAGIGDGSRLILDAEAETYALIDATVVKLPALMDAGGSALALQHLHGGRAGGNVDLAVARGIVQSSLERLAKTLGQSGRVAVDDPLERELRAPLRELTWDTTSLMSELTARRRGGSPRGRSAAAPATAYALWKLAADRLDERLQARGDSLEQRERLVLGAAGLLLALAIVVALLLRRDRRRSAALAAELGLQESLLHETQARYRTLVEHLPAVTYLLEASHLVYVSPKLEALLGYDPEEWLGDPGAWARAIHPEDLSIVKAEFARLADGIGSIRLEYRMLAHDGREVWVRDEAAPILDEAGNLLHIQGVLLDVTERRQAEQDRDRMELELQVASKLEAVGQLASGIAHEINTPIQFVGDSVRFLRDAVSDLFELVGVYREQVAAAGTGVDADRVTEAEEIADLEYLEQRVPAAFERTFDGVGRVTTIVSAMKSFSHTTAVGMAPADLDEAIRTTLVVCANEYKYVADVETDFAELPPVVCHIGDLNQVFLNLVVNAAHAIEDTGAERGTIAIRTAVDGDDAVVTVSDTGCGMPDDVRARIFDPFYTTKEVGRGTGQGLALARSIVVDKHGGSIDVQTAPGAGTTFVIRVPLAGRTEPAAGDGAAPAALTGP